MDKVIVSLLLAMLPGSAPAAVVDFNRDVAPILRSRCIGCHGPAIQQGGLRLDSREAAWKVITPGNSAGSRLMVMVSGQDAKRSMPPAGPRLTVMEVARLRSWIDQGAQWPDGVSLSPANLHWALQPIRRVALPAVRNSKWVRNDIDRLVLAKLEPENIAPSPEAPRHTLIRRASLDLTGLPPTPAEVDQFLKDTRPDAYERLVDRLLESRHFGEKWALHWLDQARYADSDGYEKDSRRPYAWRWRDWVIDAFNRDMPFDRFTIEQIAGDLLPGSTMEQRIATGFHRNTPTNREGGVNIEMFRYEQVVDRASTVGSVWLGLTVGCAQCHDHKYDPITQQDFYRLFAFFDNADEASVEAPLPGELGPHLAAHEEYYRQRNILLTGYKALELRPDWEKRALMAADEPGKWTDWDVVFDTIQKMVDDGERILRTPVEKRTRYEEDAIIDHMVRWYSQAVDNARYKELKFKELEEKLAALKKSFPELSQAPVLAERSGNRRTSHIHLRGSWKDRGAEVQPAIPAVFGQAGVKDRLGLAQWLVSRDNPLTARVTMNRLWQEMFGRGLVDTPADFGTQGARPSHPELLDWLTDGFQQEWSVKQALRRIATSATYRQSSAARPELMTRDPGNALLARQNSNRLPAELIRDSALSVSGLLNPAVGGRSVEPHMPASMMALAFGGGTWVTWSESTGADKYRRGMYIHRQRSVLYPMLVNFDAPNMTVTACKRERSNTPLQALNLLNDPVFLEMARGLAHRTLTEPPAGSDAAARLGHAFELALARSPSAYEQEKLLHFYREQLSGYDADSKAAAALFPYQPKAFSRAEGAAWVAVSRVLLNLDEFLTRE
jgi:hypothetical protein